MSPNPDASLLRRFLTNIHAKPITDADRERASWHLIDWLACAAAGRKSPAGDSFGRLLSAHGRSQSSAPGDASAIGTGFGDWAMVAMHNGALGNVLEMDDVHRSSILHPGPVVIPAALALAEARQLPMSELLDAIIKGYEITIRLGEAIGRSHYRYFHNTSSCAGAGAALAVAHLLELSPQQTLWAIGNALSRTGGLWQMRHEKVLTKQWHTAQAAHSGALSAELAGLELSGPESILEGQQGFFAAFSDDAQPKAFNAEHKHWRLYDCSFKPWPACRHVHPAMDVLLSMRTMALTQDPLGQVKRIDVYCYADALTFCDRPKPTTELEAKFSIQHALAAILLWGEPKMAHYQAEAFNHDNIQRLRQRIYLHVCDDIEGAYPAHFGARVEISLSSGGQLSRAHADTLGDPERPLSSEQLANKARMLLELGGMPLSACEQLLKRDWLEDASPAQLTALLGSIL